MLFDPMTLFLACLAVIILGLAKGGFSGIAMVSTPLLAQAMPPMQAAAILLPILIAGDAISVWIFRNSWNRWIAACMLPGTFVGIALGYAFSAVLPEIAIIAALGLITTCFALYRLWLERGGRIVAASDSPGWVGGLFGVGLGFTSHIAHAGAPMFQIWVLPRKLPHLEFVGTNAVVFAVVNWAKVPGYAALGEFDATNLWASAMLMPLAVVSTLAGAWLVKRFDPARYYQLIYLLMLALGLKLLWDAVAG